MSLNRKAQVSEQFNWIFVVITGGVILLFFMFVISNVMSASDAKLKATVITNFDAMLTGAQVTPNSVHVIESTRSFGFTVTCDSTGQSDLYLLDSNAYVSLLNKLVYAPAPVQGESLLVYTIPIRKPFYVGNILLFTDPDTLFFVHTQGSSDKMENIADLFPKNVTLVRGGIFEDYFKNYRHIVVMSSNPPPILNNGVDEYYGEQVLTKKSVQWIYLDGSVAKMYSKKNKQSVFDIGSPQIVPLDGPEFIPLLAFSPSAEFYQCNYDKLEHQMRHVAKVYELKATYIAEDLLANRNAGFPVAEVCINYYTSAANQFKILANSPDPYDSSSISILESLNRQLLLASCPLIY